MHRVSSSIPVFVLLVACLVGLTGGSHLIAAAQDGTPVADDQGVVGAGVVTVAVDGDPPYSFPVFQTYETGGTVSSLNLPATVADPAAPVETIYISPGVGAWESTGSDAYVATLAIMYGDVDGNVLAIETVSWDLELDESGDAFSGTSTFVGVDPAGATLYEGTSTLSGTRITVQEPGTPVTLPTTSTPAA